MHRVLSVLSYSVSLVSVAIVIRALTSPLHFYLYDEFLHWRTENDVIASGHLFTPNSLLPVSPYYPGLEIAH